MTSDRPTERLAPPGAAITIVDFWADWCGACRMLDAVLTRIAAAHPDVAVRKVNVEADAAVAAEMAVRALPTLVFTAADGRELGRLSGTMTGRRIEATLAAARAALA